MRLAYPTSSKEREVFCVGSAGLECRGLECRSPHLPDLLIIYQKAAENPLSRLCFSPVVATWLQA